MRSSVAHDLDDSSYDFLRVVWPIVSPWCGGGEYKSLEELTNDLTDNNIKKYFDLLAGIDGIHLLPDGLGMQGIASRIQWEKDWRTFTVRETRGTGAKTELGKRLHAIRAPERGVIYPHFTVQAYISKRRTGHLMSVAMAYTNELIPYAADLSNKGVTRKRVQEDNGTYNWFRAVNWNAYARSGRWIEYFHANDPANYLGMTVGELLDWIEEMEQRGY